MHCLSLRLVLVLLASVLAAACGDDGPTSPSPIDPVSSPGPHPSSSYAPPASSRGGSSSSASISGGGSAFTAGSPVPGVRNATGSTAPGLVTNLTARQSGCLTDTPPNAAELRWNPPLTGAAAASFAVKHYGTAPPQYIWMPGETIPASYAPWSAGHCAVEGGQTVCKVVFSGFGYEEHRFGVTARTGPQEVSGHTAHVTVTIGDCSGSTTGSGSVPGQVLGLGASQVTDTTDVIVSWDTPSAQTGVASPTSYTLSGGPAAVTLQAGSCTQSPAAPDCSHSFSSVAVGAYGFSVAAVNGDGTGTAATTSLTVTAIPVPGPVRALSAQQTDTTGTVVLTWQSPATGQVASYAVARAGASVGTVPAGSCSVLSWGKQCTFSDTGVSYGAHTYSVAAVNSTGAGDSTSVTLDVLPPLTASVTGVPATYGGRPFTFTLTFSENPSLGFRKVRNRIFTVENARLSMARRVTRGSNVSWLIGVNPTAYSSDALPSARWTIGITLPPTTSCTADSAVCTADGRVQTSRLELSIPW